LVSSTTADGDVVTYEYDDENIRVSSTVNGVKTTYLVDSNRPYAQVLEEYEDENLKVRYVHGLDLISVEQDGEVSVYLVDGLGSTRVLTDLDGEVVATYTYDAFGELLDSTGEVENDYLFAGEQFDGELEQYYLRQRFYDAGVGRFTRRDTYEGRIGEPITLHKYLYGNANPVNFIDPSGLTSINELTSTRNILDILSSSVRIGNRFLSLIDKANDTISLMQSIQQAFRLASNPSAWLPNFNLSDISRFPDLQDAANSLSANSSRIFTSIITRKVPVERKQIAKYLKAPKSAFAFYLPDVFPSGLNLSTGLNIHKKPLKLVTNRQRDRLFGIGMLFKSNKIDKSFQFFRMDYGAFNHTPGGDRKNYDTWQDGDFHYHIPKN
jgi:RHS repeat-associated protein